MNKYFGKDGLLSKKLGSYEYRPSQLRMAEAVNDILTSRGVLLAEAETGIGKTLAYLVPIALSGRRVVVSTGTKNLQEQLFRKDIPLVEKIMGKKLKSCCIKGRRNYLCLLRYAETGRHLLPELKFDEEQLNAVKKWLGKTVTGDIEEAEGVPENSSLWRYLTVESDACLGSRCSYFEKCFVTKIRQKAMESDIVVVNHHLYFSDLAVRRSGFGEVIPEHYVAVFDEAHVLEKVATGFFGVTVSSGRISSLLSDVQRGFPVIDNNCLNAISVVKNSSAKVFELLKGYPSGSHSLKPFAKELQHEASGLEAELERLKKNIANIDGEKAVIDVFSERCSSIAHDISFIASMKDSSFVYWFETGIRTATLKASPINVASLLKESLFNGDKTLILTSATISVEGKFNFLENRLGIEDAEKIRLKSLFDYSTQAMLYLPAKMPEPNSGNFRESLYGEIIAILNVAKGGVFLLFTSFENLNYVYERLSGESSFTLFKQGDISKSILLDNFKKSLNGVLLGTFSFWEGVDVQGEALKCVVIDRLPFEVPSDPVVAARSEFLKKSGANPFTEYQLPQAAILLKQGLGRLIRSKSDRGLLAVLDPRILTKHYGKVFMNTIPRSPVIRSLEKATPLLMKNM